MLNDCVVKYSINTCGHYPEVVVNVSECLVDAVLGELVAVESKPCLGLRVGHEGGVNS
jgi:hypothetical protein